VGLAGTYLYGAAKFRRAAGDGFRLSDPPAPGTPDFTRLVEGLTGAPLRQGNHMEVLRNGCQAFPSMLESIRSARRTIDFSSYIYWPGAVTTRFTDAFVERARAGIEVNIVLDGYGSAKVGPALVHRLQEAGATVTFFRPPRWYAIHKLNNRMHRRLLVIDGTVGFAGGVGLADVWDGDAQDPDHWRETHARIEGPAVRDLLGGFLENWTEATQEVVAGSHFPELESFDDGIALQVTRSSPSTGGTAAALLFCAAIAGARRRLWLTTAYFTAPSAFFDLLRQAAQRGVDVRVMVNGPNVDKQIVRLAGQRSYSRLLEAGVRVFEYQPTMLHAKILIADDWANLGSSNFDHRSFSLDAELNVAVTDPGVVGQLASQFLDDLAVSEEMEIEAWRGRPLRQRANELAGELLRQSF